MKEFNTREPTCFSVVYQNLLLPNYQRVLYLHNGGVILERDNDLYPAYTFFDYYQQHYVDTFIDKSQIPHLISTASGSFTHLDSVRYSNDIIDYLNSNGLEIYFYETIFLDISKNKKQSLNTPVGNINNLNLDIEYNNIKHILTGFESTEENLANLYCFEFEKINNFVKNNKLSNVTICTGDYQISDFLQTKYPLLKFKTKDIYTASLFKQATDHFNSYEYDIKLPSLSANTIQYKFWCGNRRYEGYRHIVAAYLYKKLSLVSYQYTLEDSHFKLFDQKMHRTGPLWGDIEKYLWFDFKKWELYNFKVYKQLISNLKEMNETSIDVDIKHDQALESLPTPVETYNKVFCAVITEQRYSYPMGTFSEKTLNAIKCLRPFVLVAPPKTLEYLKSFGVETFGDIWDESYDQELNHERRLLKIFEVIDYIDSFSIEQLQDLYKKLQPRLEHNYKIIRNICL